MLSSRLYRLKQTITHARPEVYAERALLVTAACTENQGKPPVALRAAAMEHIFEKGAVRIRDDELIVGSKTSTPMGSPLYPEFNCEWIKRELDTIRDRFETAFYVSDETGQTLKDKVVPFWDNQTVYDRILENVRPECLEAVDEGIFFHYYLNRSIGHLTVNYEKVLKKGFKGIRDDITQALSNPDPLAPEQKEFLTALQQVVDAVVIFAQRHAALAQKLSETQKDAGRKKELEAIARVCRNVPENPAQSFHEALQSFWFVHLMLNLESNSYAISPGRFDQYMYPFFKKDLDAGVITKDGARELLNCLWVKFAELTVVKEGGTAKASNTYADFQNLNIGGLTEQGLDGVNDISYMCLEAQSELMLPQPQLSCLISRRSPGLFILRACELARKGTGMPAFYNADELILALVEKGKTLEDARKGGVNGCVEITGQGNDNMASSGYVNLAKCLEFALNNGAGMISGRNWGPKTGLPESIDSMERLWEIFEIQIREMVRLKHHYDEGARKAFEENCPALCTSLVVDDCISKGLDFHQGGARYNLPMMCGVGTGTVADSLAAIEHFVFEKKYITLDGLVAALKSNFKGHETLQILLWKKGPKFGNNDDAADRHAVRLIRTFAGILKDFKNRQGVPYAANMIPTTTHLPFGHLTGATPDGRLSGMPLAEGISPVQGKDIHGPTAVIRTMGKIDHAATAGTLLNMKFSPETLEGDLNLKKFASLIQTYFDLGGHHMQFNVVDRETLLKAQQYPDEYRSLLIRVAGYSDYFVNLSRDVQDEVISRTTHEVA